VSLGRAQVKLLRERNIDVAPSTRSLMDVARENEPPVEKAGG